MSYSGPFLLTSDHALAGFDCGKAALNSWLLERALRNQAGGASRTWVVTDDSTSLVVAFYASCAGAVLRSRVPKPLGRDQPEELPVILLGRMAVDVKHAGQGLGAAMLKHFMLKAAEVAERVGVRLVLVHAKDDEARGFYLHHGFVESPVDPLTLMMLLPVRHP